MVSLFYSGLIFYCNSIIQNVYFILLLTKNLASPETFAYRYLAFACSQRGRKENQRCTGHHMFSMWGSRISIKKTNNRSLDDFCF